MLATGDFYVNKKPKNKAKRKSSTSMAALHTKSNMLKPSMS